MEASKEATNERSGKGDEKPCVVKDISVHQFSEGGALRKSAEENQQSAATKQQQQNGSDSGSGSRSGGSAAKSGLGS